MHVTRKVKQQLIVFSVVSLTAAGTIVFGYMRLPSLFGIDRYDVTMALSDAAGLYPRANVTYRGTEVGEVTDVHLTDTGVVAVLSLESGIDIPSDLDAAVHSQTAVGEQYVALVPRADEAAPLRNGDVIPLDRTSVPPPIDVLLDATNRGLQAIPGENLETLVDESYTAFGGLGPEIARIVRGSAALARDARENLDEVINVVDNVGPLLDTQTNTSTSVQAWAANLASTTRQLQVRDDDVRGILQNGPAAAAEARRLVDRLQPTLPVLLANLASVAPVLLTYDAGIEQLLVLLPRGIEAFQAATLGDRDVLGPYKGLYLNFNLTFNIPPSCSTGFLPIQQMRAPSEQDYPDRPTGDLYCRIPQDSPFNVRGARNIPCVTRPGKRAPTVKLCESDESYVPLNDGYNWKGDPNATLSGQDVPQLPPPTATTAPTIAAAEYDPATGTYVGPDGRTYTQTNLAQSVPKERTWQSMLLPPSGN